MTEDKIQEKIDAWHLDGAGAGQELWTYMGWTFEQYQEWLKSGGVPSD